MDLMSVKNGSVRKIKLEYYSSIFGDISDKDGREINYVVINGEKMKFQVNWKSSVNVIYNENIGVKYIYDSRDEILTVEKSKKFFTKNEIWEFISDFTSIIYHCKRDDLLEHGV
ncbi:hypothetical protein, partial [Metallosphaera sp.]|uniref:hypothetical protein n=1 Tax=Metallosphaera sp. TaxID=2020860 RepID=UPI00316EDDB3